MSKSTTLHETWVALRNGEPCLRLAREMRPEVRGGKLVCHTSQGDMYVVDGVLADRDGVKAQVAALAPAHRWSEIDAKALAGPGVSESGLELLTLADYYQRKDEAAAVAVCAKYGVAKIVLGRETRRPGEPGTYDLERTVTVTDSTGHEWRFLWRNIFDFGAVVNPLYHEGGGIPSRDVAGNWYWDRWDRDRIYFAEHELAAWQAAAAAVPSAGIRM
jgi:ribosomal protein L18E